MGWPPRWHSQQCQILGASRSCAWTEEAGSKKEKDCWRDSFVQKDRTVFKLTSDKMRRSGTGLGRSSFHWSSDHESRPATIVFNAVIANVDCESSSILPLMRPSSGVALDYFLGNKVFEPLNFLRGTQFSCRFPNHLFAGVAIQNQRRCVRVQHAQRFLIQYPQWHCAGFQQAAIEISVIVSHVVFIISDLN